MNTVATAGAPPMEQAEPNASVTDWIAVMAGSVGAFMAVLDISITNSALPQIQGELGASGTEGTWIGTGYLVAEVVMIPLAAWFTRVLGLRTFLLICVAFFTVFSVLCGLSQSLPEMIIGRVGQGFSGGALIPTAQMIVATRLPRHQMPLGMTVFGLTVLLGPMAGPVAGGWLAENVSWHWCFFLNLPVGIGLVILLLLGLPRDKMNLHLFKDGDWLGIAGFAVGLSCLTVLMEEGQRERWFESALIWKLTGFMLVGFVLLTISQFTSKDPVIKLRLLRSPPFAGVVFIVAVVGGGMYGVLYLLPQFLAIVGGYNSEQAGMVMLISGVPAFLLIPFLPKLISRVNVRWLVAVGLLASAASCMLDTDLTAQTGGNEFFWSQILRGLGQILAMMPLNQAALAAVSRANAGDGAGIFNMARNLGGSIGLALTGVLIDRRTALHSDAIRETVTANSPLAWERLHGMSAALGHGDPASGSMRAFAVLSRQIELQATVITYSECFWLLGIVMMLTIPAVYVLKQPQGFMTMRGRDE